MPTGYADLHCDEARLIAHRVDIHGQHKKARRNAGLAARAVPEWQATLDALQELDGISAGGPVGFWGLSMGCAIGVPSAAAEPRITVPVEFVLQWDDELIPRDSGLALFDAFASREKTLHANPGRHQGVPAFELESSERFFTRHLVEDAPTQPWRCAG